MAQSNIKLTGLDKQPVDSPELSADFRAAEKFGPFRVGKTGFYYRSGLKKIYVPIADIDHAFTRVREVSTHCCCGGYSMHTYSLVLCSKGAEIADIYADEDEGSVDKAQAALKARKPEIELGFTKKD